MADDPAPDEESLESFYGDEADALPAATGEPRAKPHVGEGRKRTVTGALMTGIALGFRQVFEPEYHDRTAVEQPAPEQPTEPQKYEIHLDPVAPESSFAIYRPWIDGSGGPDPDSDPEPEPDAEPDVPPAPAVHAERPQGGGMGALGG
ncbi:MAG: hypothetical protein QOG43_444 [Actinomycetota bacterium]|nr:hypothetical protein [Actinomycetota bacterium]